MSKGKCRSCKHDLSDDYSTIRTNACPDYLDGNITDGCELYQPDEDTTLSLKEQAKKEKIEAKEREKHRKKQEKAEARAYEDRYRYKRRRSRDPAMRMIYYTLPIVAVLLLAVLFYFPTKETTTETPPDDRVDPKAENITRMIEDLAPSFVLLVFVMVFMLMLLTIVDRVGRC